MLILVIVLQIPHGPPSKPDPEEETKTTLLPLLTLDRVPDALVLKKDNVNSVVSLNIFNIGA